MVAVRVHLDEKTDRTRHRGPKWQPNDHPRVNPSLENLYAVPVGKMIPIRPRFSRHPRTATRGWRSGAVGPITFTMTVYKGYAWRRRGTKTLAGSDRTVHDGSNTMTRTGSRHRRTVTMTRSRRPKRRTN